MKNVCEQKKLKKKTNRKIIFKRNYDKEKYKYTRKYERDW